MEQINNLQDLLNFKSKISVDQGLEEEIAIEQSKIDQKRLLVEQAKKVIVDFRLDCPKLNFLKWKVGIEMSVKEGNSLNPKKVVGEYRIRATLCDQSVLLSLTRLNVNQTDKLRQYNVRIKVVDRGESICTDVRSDKFSTYDIFTAAVAEGIEKEVNSFNTSNYCPNESDRINLYGDYPIHSKEEINQLIKDWEEQPDWDLQDAVGYERYYEQLYSHSQRKLYEWQKEAEATNDQPLAKEDSTSESWKDLIGEGVCNLIATETIESLTQSAGKNIEAAETKIQDLILQLTQRTMLREAEKVLIKSFMGNFANAIMMQVSASILKSKAFNKENIASKDEQIMN